MYYLVDSPKVFKILNLGGKEQDNIHFKKQESEFGLFKLTIILIIEN